MQDHNEHIDPKTGRLHIHLMDENQLYREILFMRKERAELKHRLNHELKELCLCLVNPINLDMALNRIENIRKALGVE